ncbi:FG-GAP-like repeat-containing protein, partial [Chryseobacterium rhizosphaerae]
FFSIIVSCISILGFSQTASGQKFHDTKGNIEVTQAGQLQYTLAIETPPGVQKVAPNISLTYVSGARNGLAGYAWNVSGATSISRVGKNLEKDGVTKGVQLDYTDYYSFNGQRLILKSGEYGKDGAEYVTEKYSNVKIKSVGSVSGQPWQGPEYWEVTSPDGSRAWYGATAPGNNPARTPIDYNIVKSIDINGNYVTYSYIADGNISLIGSVEWGGNEIKNTPHSNKIEFLFGDRPIPETAYIKGVEFAQPKLLESVVVWIGSTMYKRYNISYKKDLQETAYRYVDKITVVNSNNEEANPVLFTYEQSLNSGWRYTSTLRPDSSTDVVGDFNGDGNLDLIRYHSTTSAKIPQIGLYLYSNFYETEPYREGPVFIGNSLSDLYNAVVVNLKKNGLIRNRQGFVTQKKVTNPSTSKSDLELSFYSLSEDNQLVLDYKKTIPNADYDESVGTFYNGTRTTVLGLKNVDFNGDGLSELVLQLSDRTCTQVPVEPARLPSTCDNSRRYYVIDPDESIQNNGWYYPLYLYEDYEDRDKDLFTLYRAGDFNGDGTFDFLKLSQDKKPLLITFKKNAEGKYDSSIAYFNPTSNETIKGYWEDSLVGDFNGDGLSDIMMPGTSTSAIWYLYTSKGNGFKEETKVFERPEKTRRVFKDGDNIKIHNPRTFVAFDINNDGKTELILLESGRYYEKSNIQDNNQSVRYTRYLNSWADVWTVVGGGHNPSFQRTGYFSDDYSILYLNSGNIDAELAPSSNDRMGLTVDVWTGAMLGRFVFASALPLNNNVEEKQGVVYRRYFDIAMNARVTSISQGGVITDITYKQLDKKANPGLYDGAKTESYPYVEISQSKGIYVVSGLTRSTTSDKKLKQDFRYRGLTSNILGKGMVGFRKTARSSWYADGFENTKIWSGVETDPVNDGVPIKEWSIRTNDETKIFPADVSENNTQLLSFKSTTYQIDKLLNSQVVATVPDADKAKVVTAIVPKTSKGKDFLTNATAESTITYGAYYLPVQSLSKINSSLAETTTTYEYNNNPSGAGADYY